MTTNCRDCEGSGCSECRKPKRPTGAARVTKTVEICDLSVEITADVYPIIPARTNCSNDDATPQEGGEIEYVEAFVKDARDASGKRLSFDIADYLSMVNEKESARIDDALGSAVED